MNFAVSLSGVNGVREYRLSKHMASPKRAKKDNFTGILEIKLFSIQVGFSKQMLSLLYCLLFFSVATAGNQFTLL